MLCGSHTAQVDRLSRRVAARPLPKGIDVCFFSQDELDGIADSLNTKPRAAHEWHTPLEVFAQTLASALNPSTSDH